VHAAEQRDPLDPASLLVETGQQVLGLDRLPALGVEHVGVAATQAADRAPLHPDGESRPWPLRLGDRHDGGDPDRGHFQAC
jgi:hypothetical protein